jgi:hypothetical protein
VTVFLYSIRRFSSFTLSSPLIGPSLADPLPQKRRQAAFRRRNTRRSVASRRRYHFCVLKNEETLFLMMKRHG